MARQGSRLLAGSALDRRRPKDGFATLRLVVACGIITLHARPITGLMEGASWGGTWYHYGTLTVAAFMAMSGFFVMKTWERDPHLVRFWVRRALRIMPGLIGVLLVSALILGPLVSTLAPADYFAHPETWTYLLRNTLLFPQQYSLPGVFADNPYPGAVNGSLWCLPIEVLGYVLVTIVGLLGIARRRILIFALALPFGALLVLNVNELVQLPPTMLLLLANPLMQYLAIYAMGIAAWLYRDRIPLSWWGVLACVVVEIVSQQTPVGEITRAVTVPYAVLTIGTKLPSWLCLPQWLTVTSFGVFLYGFPVEQTLAYFGADHQLEIIGFGIPIAIVLGLLSWHLIEKHALRLRTALTGNAAAFDQRRTTPAGGQLPSAADPPTVELPAVYPPPPQPAGRPAGGR